VFPFSSRNSTPVARGVESDERISLPTLAPERTAVSATQRSEGQWHALVRFGLDLFHRYPRSGVSARRAAGSAHDSHASTRVPPERVLAIGAAPPGFPHVKSVTYGMRFRTVLLKSRSRLLGYLR